MNKKSEPRVYDSPAPEPTMAMDVAISEPSASILQVAAKLPPRDIPAVVKGLSNVVANMPHGSALDLIYCRPVGKKGGLQSFATGFSVRFAEIAQQQFGRMWISGDTVERGDTVVAKCMCFDLTTMNITFGQKSKSIVGKMGRYSDSMIEVTKSALLSIARRDAIVQQTRPQMESVMADVRTRIIADLCPEGGKHDAQTAWNTLQKFYEKHGMTTADMRKISEGESKQADKIILLVGVLNYINDDPKPRIMEVLGKEATPSKPAVRPTTEKTAPTEPQEPSEWAKVFEGMAKAAGYQSEMDALADIEAELSISPEKAMEGAKDDAAAIIKFLEERAKK